MNCFYVYMLTNKGRTTLYVGITNSLMRRVSEHRCGEADGFTARYNLNRLVFFEHYDDPRDAIAREKQLKRWRRDKKESLIVGMNKQWEDLGDTMLGLGPAPQTCWHDATGECGKTTVS